MYTCAYICRNSRESAHCSFFPTDKWFEVPRLTLCLETLLDFCTNMYVVKDHCPQLQNLLLIAHIDEQQQVDVIYDTYGLIITPIYGVNDHICHNRASIGLRKKQGGWSA